MEEATSTIAYYHILQNYGIYRDISFENIISKALEKDLSNNIFFRGQLAKYKTITSGIAREDSYVQNEHEMYVETLSNKQSDFESLNTPLEYLSKMQHYGMPTRLVDFTINPFIALFFAVQNTSIKEDSIIYVFQGQSVDANDNKVKLLSLLPTIKDRSVNKLKHEMKDIFKVDMSREEILKIINCSYFINYTKRLKESNPRLNNQDGTFAICGNNTEGDMITNEIKTIDISSSVLKIRVSFVFKKKIKNELDVYFKINDNFIYPELTSWSDYIRIKYKQTNFDPTDQYTVVRVRDVSIPEVRRKEIQIVLNQELTFEEIKRCVIMMLRSYIDNTDIVWFFVASSGNNYTINNWIVTGQWISPSTPKRFSRIQVEKLDENNIYWEEGDAPKEKELYARKFLFKEDKELFIQFHYSFQILYPLFHSIELGYEVLDFEDFSDEVSKRAHLINQVTNQVNKFGRSRNSDFDSYLTYYCDYMVSLSDITFWASQNTNVVEWIDYRINSCFSKIRRALEGINNKKSFGCQSSEFHKMTSLKKIIIK